MKNTMPPPNAPAEAFAVLDQVTAAFNRKDTAGMDATLHFPHVFPGKKMTIWEKPQSLDTAFFSRLVESGWAFSRYTKKEVLLASGQCVHFLVEYERCRTDGGVLSKQAAIWIVACVDGRWGIQVRSNE
jgi:hypothetical protein